VLLVAGCASDSAADASTTSSTTASTSALIDTSPVCQSAIDVAAVLSSVDVTDRRGISELPDALSRLADVVPSELAGDVSVLSSAVGSFVAVLERFDFDAAAIEADPDARAELASLDGPEASAAADRIQAWLGEQCA
jgi:hypothetical protein